jgi:prepilin-type processing-associated H-X9-DG protein
MGSATAADGDSTLTVRDNTVIMHPDTGGTIGVASELNAGDWLCQVLASDNDVMSVYADTVLAQVYLNASAPGSYVLTWKACNDNSLPVVHRIKVVVKAVAQVTVRHLRKARGLHVYRAKNPNSNVLWWDGQVALDGTATCLYGRFTEASPEGSVVVGPAATKKFRSQFGPKYLDWVCTTPDGTMVGFHDTSNPGARSLAHVWGKTFK